MNSRIKHSRAVEWDDRPDSVTVKLGALSLSILKFMPFTVEEPAGADAKKEKAKEAKAKRSGGRKRSV